MRFDGLSPGSERLPRAARGPTLGPRPAPMSARRAVTVGAPRADRVVRAAEAMGEATVPAEQPAAGQAARIPAPDVDAGGPGDPEVAPGQGPRPALGLIWRVRDRSTFAALRGAERVRRGPLTVSWLDDGQAPPPRLAFAVNRKVGSAVTRNRLRRRLRELARRSCLAPGVWFVSVGPGAGEATFGALSAWWSDAVGVLEGRP
jgi:ribonuclease P protein component